MVAIEPIFDEIGGFSYFQVIMIVWVYSIKAVIAWSMLLMSFGGFKPTHVCILDGVFNQTLLPFMSDDEIEERAEIGLNDNSLINTCGANGSDCTEFCYLGSKRTVISEWDIICDHKWLKAIMISIQFCGVLTGSTIGGQMGDYFGRKKTLYFSYLLNAIFNVIAAFSVNWQMFTVMRFFVGATVGMVLVMIVPYPTEFFPLKWRHTIPAIPMWPCGLIVFAGAAWQLEDWSHLHLLTAALALPGLLGYFWIPESARWLATRGRLEESYEVLQKMARVNKKVLPPSTMDTIKAVAEQEKKNRTGRDYSYIDVFRTKATAKLTLIFAFQWAVLSMVFYGISFAVTSFAGNLYLNMFLMNVVQLPSHLLSFLLIDRIGRRWTCLGFLSISVVVSFACVGLHLEAPDEYRDSVISWCCLVAKLAISACWSASQTWVTESYPTVIRGLGYGFANMASRVGAIVAPFVINLDDMPLFTFILMGSLSFISVLGTAFLPETRNKVMEETTLKQNNGTTTEEERKSKDLEKNRLDLDLDPQRLPKFSGEKPTPSGHDAEKGVSNAAYSSTPESSRL